MPLLFSHRHWRTLLPGGVVTATRGGTGCHVETATCPSHSQAPLPTEHLRPPSRWNSQVLSFSSLRRLCDSISFLQTSPRLQHPLERM